jgi:hypothetical protein
MGSYRQLSSSIGYFIGCVLLIPASTILLAGTSYDTSISLYIAACAFLIIASIIDFLPVVTNRPTITKDQESLIDQKLNFSGWITQFWVTLLYLLGGICFEIGSIMYWSTFGPSVANLGTWVFRTGSFFYIGGSVISLLQILKPTFDKSSPKKQLEVSSYMWISVIVFYLLGSVAFVTGGILSQLELKFSVESWVIGSAFFAAGATTSLTEVIRSWNK